MAVAKPPPAMAILVYGDAPEMDANSDEMEHCVHPLDAQNSLDHVRALLVFAPARNYLRLVAYAQTRRPPVQVLIVTEQPHRVRAELRVAGTPAEVLRSPVHWQEIRRRFGSVVDEKKPQ